MLRLKEVREYVSSLDITTDDRVYIGKLDNKKEQSIGVYSRSESGLPITPLGGYQNGSYAVKAVSLLVHWTKNKDDSERAAQSLYEKIQKETKLIPSKVRFVRLMVPEPQDVGTDDSGVYEYVIWLDFIYNKEVE